VSELQSPETSEAEREPIRRQG